MVEAVASPYRIAYARGLEPAEQMTVSECADRYRKLPSKGAAEHGDWFTSRTPHIEEIQDCFGTDHPCTEVVAVLPSQSAKTEAITNILLYRVVLAPCPVLIVQPTDSALAKFSKQRLAPTIACTPALRERIADSKTRDSGNTIDIKDFPGGIAILASAGSPSQLASMPAQVVLLDEVDRFGESAGAEGNPIKVAVKRTTTFGIRKKIGYFSTPTIAGHSRIMRLFERSDKRVRMVHCPHCGEAQTLEWENLVWTAGHPETAHYVCERNGCVIEESAKVQMLPSQKHVGPTGAYWLPTAKSRMPGFHMNALYLPLGWDSWALLAEEYDEAVSTGDPEDLKTFWNTRLARVFDATADYTPPDGWDDGRGEKFAAPCPAGVGVLVAGVDVQDDRLEIEVVGYGKDQESWSVDYKTLPGDPRNEGKVWQDLDRYLSQQWAHETHAPLRIEAVCVDTGGHATEDAYKYTATRGGRRIWGIKGAPKRDAPMWNSKVHKGYGKRYPFYLIGTNAIKDRVLPRFQIREPGPGYCHVPVGRDSEWYAQIRSEVKRVVVQRGRPIVLWDPIRRRNEALDCRVYAYAALCSLLAAGHTVERLLDERLPRGQPVAVRVAPRPSTSNHGLPSADWLDR